MVDVPHGCAFENHDASALAPNTCFLKPGDAAMAEVSPLNAVELRRSALVPVSRTESAYWLVVIAIGAADDPATVMLSNRPCSTPGYRGPW